MNLKFFNTMLSISLSKFIEKDNTGRNVYDQNAVFISVNFEQAYALYKTCQDIFQARPAGQRGVDDDPHPGHGQGGLGDVRGHDHPAPARGGGRQGGVLGGGGQAPVQRQDVDGLGQRAAQAGDDVVDLARPGQEDEGVPGPLVQGPLSGGGDVADPPP